jgi:hypothetical protein
LPDTEDCRWGELKQARPDLAEAGRALLYQYGVGLAFLGTVKPDGGPRVHPICPVIVGDGMYALLIPSPKRKDLLRDGRFALHTFAAEDNEDAFYMTGSVIPAENAAIRAEIEQQFRDERSSLDLREDALREQGAFEFMISTCLLTRTTGHGDPRPRHLKWHAPSKGS